MSKICPWCKKIVSQKEIDSCKTFTNGGEQTNDMLEVYHEDCAEEAEEYEREMGMRV